MKEYQSLFLNALLDAFERSSIAWEEDAAASQTRKISLSVARSSEFEDYLRNDSYLYRPDIEEAVKTLQNLGFINVIYEKASNPPYLKEIRLRVENVDSAFAYAHRERKLVANEKEKEFLLSIKEGYSEESVAYRYLDYLHYQVSDRRFLQSVFGKKEELPDFLKEIDAIEKQEEDIFLRNFSVSLSLGSKAVERKISALRKAFEIAEGKTYESDTDFLYAHHIHKNPEYILIKGPIVVSLNGTPVDLDKIGEPIGIPSTMIGRLQVVSTDAERLLTIENLTTFHYCVEPKSVMVYAKGFSTESVIKLLMRLQDQAHFPVCYHCGDIDWGGFNILLSLRKRTHIPFVPYRMGKREYEENKAIGQPLTENDRKNLSSMLLDPSASEFHELIKRMLGDKGGYKVEQEALSFAS